MSENGEDSRAGTPTEEEKTRGCVSGAFTKMQDRLEDGFGWLGKLCANKPYLVMGLSVLVCLLCAIGFVNFASESRPEKLWVSQGTPAVRDSEYVTETWQYRPRYNEYYATSKSGDILTAAGIQKLYSLYTQTMAINVSAESHSDQFPGSWNFMRACVRAGSECLTYCPLDLFDYNATLINSLSDADVVARVNDDSNYYTSYGSPITKNDIFGYENGNVVCFRGVYVLDDHTVSEDNERVDVVGEPWEEKGIDVYKTDNDPLYTLPMFRSSWSIEFSKAIRGDSTLIVVAYLLIIIYLICTLGRRDPVDCMVGVSFCAVISVGMALCASWGLVGGLGVKFNPLCNNIPFLLVGLGVDDAFILVSNFQRAMKAHGDKEKAMEIAMRKGGMSILITSMTDFLAFVIGSSTALPALSSFCVYAGVGVLFDFFFQITFFMACVSLNANRTKTQRRDCFCCVKFEEKGFKSQDSEPRGCWCFGCKQDVMEPAFEKYAKTLLHPISHAVVLSLFVLFIGLSSYGVENMPVNFKLDWFLPESSYINTAIDWQKSYFTPATPFNVFIKDIDHFNRQNELHAINTNFFQASQWIDAGTPSYYFSNYMIWAAATAPYSSSMQTASGVTTSTNSTLFYNGLKSFLSTANGTKFNQDVLWKDDSDPTAGIRASRGGASISVTEFTNSGKEKYEALEGLRKDLHSVMPYDDARVYSLSFLYWEEYSFIKQELVKNILIAMAVMLFIVTLLIMDWEVVAAVGFAIGATVLDTLGMAYYWGVELNSVVTIFVLIAIGLSVDYSAHIGHSYKEATGTPAQRMVTAVKTTGPPVFNAVFSTFIAILVLASSQTYVFQVFFQMFLLTSLLGGFHGLVVLPVLLHVFGSLVTKDTNIEDVEMISVTAKGVLEGSDTDSKAGLMMKKGVAY